MNRGRVNVKHLEILHRLSKESHATELRHRRTLRPGCRSILATKFRHSAELIGPTKVPLPFSFALRIATPLSLRAGWRKTACHPPTEA